MRYLLLEYTEKPVFIADMPEVKYSYEKNLNVLEKTNEPAIDLLETNLVTETFTKVYNEAPDSDNDFQVNLVTQTLTLVHQENPDTDADIHSFAMSLITMTTTRVELESTDQD